VAVVRPGDVAVVEPVPDDRVAALDRVRVVGVVAVRRVRREQRLDRGLVVALPGFDVAVEPGLDGGSVLEGLLVGQPGAGRSSDPKLSAGVR